MLKNPRPATSWNWEELYSHVNSELIAIFYHAKTGTLIMYRNDISSRLKVKV